MVGECLESLSTPVNGILLFRCSYIGSSASVLDAYKCFKLHYTISVALKSSFLCPLLCTS